MGDLGTVKRLDDSPLAQDALVPVRREQGFLNRLTRAGEAIVVHPLREPLKVDHMFPTSNSRYSANLAFAASNFPGIHWVGHMASVLP